MKWFLYTFVLGYFKVPSLTIVAAEHAFFAVVLLSCYVCVELPC
jgi:hypothetical protein